MTQIRLFDTQRRCQGAVEFIEVPVLGPNDYRCTPEGLLAVERAIEVSRELDRGRISGWTGPYRWHRQVEAPGKRRVVP